MDILLKIAFISTGLSVVTFLLGLIFYRNGILPSFIEILVSLLLVIAFVCAAISIIKI